eukprot:3338959-Amphidinium_carterae.1
MSAEVANKRLTLTGLLGMFSQAGLTGSASTTLPRHCEHSIPQVLEGEVNVKNPRAAEIKHDS